MARILSKERNRLQGMKIKNPDMFISKTRSYTTIGELRSKRKQERINRKKGRN